MHRINVLEYLQSNDTTKKKFWFLCVELETSQKNFPNLTKSDFLPFLAWFWPIFRKTKKSIPRRSILDFRWNFFSARKPYISCLQVDFEQKQKNEKKFFLKFFWFFLTKMAKIAYIFPYNDKNGQNWLKMTKNAYILSIYRQKWPKIG